jgi:hypothetical protein
MKAVLGIRIGSNANPFPGPDKQKLNNLPLEIFLIFSQKLQYIHIFTLFSRYLYQEVHLTTLPTVGTYQCLG